MLQTTRLTVEQCFFWLLPRHLSSNLRNRVGDLIVLRVARIICLRHAWVIVLSRCARLECLRLGYVWLGYAQLGHLLPYLRKPLALSPRIFRIYVSPLPALGSNSP